MPPKCFLYSPQIKRQVLSLRRNIIILFVIPQEETLTAFAAKMKDSEEHFKESLKNLFEQQPAKE